MKKQTFILLIWIVLCAITLLTSISALETELDLKTIIAGIKHYDAAISSGKGTITFDGRWIQGRKETYELTFDGVSFEEAQVRVDFPIGTIATEIWDGERHWEVHRAKKLLFTVSLSAEDYDNFKNAKPKLTQSVKEQLKVHKISISDDHRFEPNDSRFEFDNTEDNYILIDNPTGRFYYIYYTEDKIQFYGTVPRYAVRPECIISPELDPRFWMTDTTMNSNAYLITPLWKVLETHESEMLQTEKIDGKETYRIRVKDPHSESFTVWISPEQGFRLVKLQRITKESRLIQENPDPKVVSYLTELILHYKEYKPDMWFPEKIEESYYPLFAFEPQKRGKQILRQTLEVNKFKINIDVSDSFQLDVPDDTNIIDYGAAEERAFGDLKKQKNKGRNHFLVVESVINSKFELIDVQINLAR